jgi:hypothetical protein
VAGFVAPFDDADVYAAHDEKYGKGGFRTVATIAARNAITPQRRQIGMLVRVLDDGFSVTRFYTLVGGILDIHWTEDLTAVVGADYKLATVDQNMAPNTVPQSNGQDTGIDISSNPSHGSNIIVLLNGVQGSLALSPSEKATSEFYFSNDGGATARAIASVVAGDSLYFNGLVAGYGLDATSDRISLVYLVTV